MKKWKKIALAKQADRDTKLRLDLSPAEKYDALADDVYVTATSVQIVQHIQNEEPGWTAENVMLAFARQAVRAHEATNCLTEIMFVDALEAARKLDKEFAATKQIKGPLHGVPISLKDMFKVKGYDHSIGFTNYCNHPSDEDGEIVKQVRAAGGIPFVKTNVPQTMLAFECANPVFGRSTNPWSPLYTCGGSSGGEGALIGCDGSPLGFGSDIGGSLRIPTSYCGIYSLKAGHSRASNRGMREVGPGFEGLREVKGPMGRSVDDIELACRVIFGKPSSLDIWLPPLGYREVEIPAKLKFGYYKSDALVRASPAVQRAVQETVDALQRKGHECVEFQVPDQVECMRLFLAICCADKLQLLMSHIGPDPKDPSLTLPSIVPNIPGPLRKFIAWAAKSFMKDPIMHRLILSFKGSTTNQFVNSTHARDLYCQRFVKEVWETYGFDGIICPVQSMPTVPHGATADVAFIASTTITYNVVDHPVGIVPVTRVDPATDQLTPEWERSGDKGSPMLYSKLYEGKKPFYNANSMKGIPVGVQIVGKHWEDEKVIKMMRVVDDALGPRGFGPGMWLRRKHEQENEKASLHRTHL